MRRYIRCCIVLMAGVLSPLYAQHGPSGKLPAADSAYTFTQTSTTLDRSEKFPVYGSNGMPTNSDNGRVVKRIVLRSTAGGAKKRTWLLDASCDTYRNQEQLHREWKRRFTVSSAGSIDTTTDSLSFILRQGSDSCSTHLVRMLLPEYGGRFVELWRLVIPPRLRTEKEGGYWGEQSYLRFHNDSTGLDQTLRCTITYTSRGTVDTLGKKTIAVQWKLLTRSIRAVMHSGEHCENDHTLWSYAVGTSYFSPDDGLLLFSHSQEDVNLTAASGIVNQYMEITTDLQRDGIWKPEGGGVTGGE